ncbi:PA2778 family cysteine peptidase [Sulfuricurvum sp.]|uniref:PA2778 family cysteine peptidase n=1 Tax=Sulfuricurvum sp. TaxID=2025608 RepID=UPI002E31504F|nr:PA2778 family cysteine peptidase [Sulfuricurvum sp.]HEX5328638.1 PA2778 family cysteine peptidase [Sulfuricurvum sp.]
MLSGCVPKDPLPRGIVYPSASINVPFIPPRENLCGSTSIQMISEYWQSNSEYTSKLSIQELDQRTFIPQKEGTLQAEMITAARANGLIAYPMEPNFEALFSELNAHHPVLVLINRSYSWYPLWHYLPVNGYEGTTRKILTHFSDQPNEPIAIETFAEMWKRSGNWGVVLLPPGEIPASASPKKFVRAVYELEKIGMVNEAIQSYQSALIRWPQEAEISLILANSYYRVHRMREAEESYRRFLVSDPSHPLAINNLAILLSETGRKTEGLKLLDSASSKEKEIQNMLRDTREEIMKK